MDDVLWDYLRAVILGAVQALTEFLPISSSGHLVLAPHLLGDEASSLTFDVGLHVGTMVAVLAFFWRDWATIAGSGLRDVRTHGVRVARWDQYSKLGLWIALGTVPAVLVGALFEGAIEEHAREPLVVGVMLVLFSAVIGVADHLGRHSERLFDVGPGRALLIGVFQAVALVPGVSRSGSTIAAARMLGFERTSAARFSFLLSAPAVTGAAVLQFAGVLLNGEDVQWGPLLLGAAVAAILGVLVIRYLLAFLAAHTLRPFVWYRIALGLLVIILAVSGVI